MRQAFTLMELMISIVLIVLITLFLFGAIASSKLSNDSLLKHSKVELERMELFELLYRDVFEAVTINPKESKDKHFTIVSMQTKNSLYDIATPYVTYYVNSKSKRLTRLESAREIKLPITYENENFVMVDQFLKEVTAFNLYEDGSIKSKNNSKKLDNNDTKNDNNNTVLDKKSKYLIFLNSDALKEPMLFEIAN
jgi:type II secretory pathway component PulJ